jgi:hypothetical protein
MGCKMRIFKAVTRLALAASIGILGLGCDKAGPVETADALKAEGPQLIKLPSSNALRKSVSVTKRITVRDGGTVQLTSFGWGLYVSASLTFQKWAVSRDVDITMTMDDQTLSFDFGPDGISFSKPAMLDVYARGLYLFGIPPGKKVKLFYIENDQSVEMNAKKISFNAWTGELSCDNGEISHFSRYAFGY